MRPNLSLPQIAATLAALAACTKEAPPATDTIQKTTGIPSASAVVAQPPPPQATATAAPATESQKQDLKKAEATDAGMKPGTIGSAAGKMSCGAGACSGSAATKKK